MRVRRCAVIFFEPRERIEFVLDRLLEGGDGLRAQTQWFAYVPHLDAELALGIEEIAALARIDATPWSEADDAAGRVGSAMLALLLERGMVVADSPGHSAVRLRDDALRQSHWKPLHAAAHMQARWRGVAAGEEARQAGYATMSELAARLGAPPTHALGRTPAASRIPLARSAATDFDALLQRRTTCRNFDPDRELPAALFAQMMERVFAAQAVVEIQPDNVVIKRNSPSGGGLHPTEAYVLVQRVSGIGPGLYHYHSVEHALEPLAPLDAAAARELSLRSVAAQACFADAHVLVALVSRFPRSFWKYRNHAKAYRVVTLDAGHLSQTLYLSATDLGLGAFVTAAINEVDIEQAFSLDPLQESPIAVCGFGWRASERTTAEFDPGGKIWPPDEA